MKKLLIELKAHVHLAFKRYCMEKEVSMKREITNYILAVIKSDLNVTTNDVIEDLIRKERERLYNIALEKHKNNRDIKRAGKERQKQHKLLKRQKYEDLWLNAQTKYIERKQQIKVYKQQRKEFIQSLYEDWCQNPFGGGSINKAKPNLDKFDKENNKFEVYNKPFPGLGLWDYWKTFPKRDYYYNKNFNRQKDEDNDFWKEDL